MDAQIAPRRTRPRPHEELLALVEGDRLLLASAPLLDLVGYSRNESTSPEFRAAYLLHDDSSRTVLSSVAHPGSYDVQLATPRGPGHACRAFLVPLDLRDGRAVRALLFIREEDADADAMPERAMRAVAASLRSETADALHRLRRLDEELAAVGDADPEVLRHELPSLLHARGGYHALDDALRGIERCVRRQGSFRRTHDAR